MALTPGTRLGPYEITAQIGVGGMGEVYQATDTNLKRAVAIKVLPASVAADAERLARFQREAEVLAALNHPNIAAIYGLERSGATTALVMELVEGPTLADRVAQGAIPTDEALPIARQIAEALEAAHEQGIIHRDLKPANIKVRPDGVVKVLDFGLAKALGPAEAGPYVQPGVGAGFSRPDTMSPTITTPAMTQAGMILGTAAYMSPEQAKGRDADKRSDIWAFGCVLYEMLTGKRAFDGEDMTDVLGAVVRLEPNWEALPSDVPQPVRTLLQSCLVKDRRHRVADISVALFVLDKAASLAPPAGMASVAPLPRRPLWRRVLTPLAAALVASTLMGTAVWFAARPVPPVQPSVRFEVPPPGASAAQMFTLSPDGRSLAFIANAGGRNQVWVRPMDALEARALAGTDDATYPFWSPDGASLGFFAQGKLKKIAIAGGPPLTLSDATDGRSGTWNRDGVILFSASPQGPILRVSAAGGVATPVTRLPATGSSPSGQSGHRFPVFLPDGAHFLYESISDTPDATGLYLGSLDGSPAVRLLPDYTNAVFVPSFEGGGSGHLLFLREDTLMAQPFDLETVKLSGEMFPVAEQVPRTGNAGFGAFSAASNGTLAYRTRGAASNRELVWMDRAGTRIAAATTPGAFNFAKLSPDQRTVAVEVMSGAQSDIWLLDAGRDVISRFTFRPGRNYSQVWAPDGKRLAFTNGIPATGSWDIYVKPSSGGGQEELLLRGGLNAFPLDWSSDGQWIVYREDSRTTGPDVWLLPLEGDRKPMPYVQTPFLETDATFAPGLGGPPRWMAYQSNESGQFQVYVQSIPPSGAKYQLSTAGGTQPRWRGDGKELFYLSTDRKLMAVPIALGPGGASVEPGTPQELFANEGITGYAPSPDGQRFLVNLPAGGEGAAAPPITVVLNWTERLNR